MKGILSLTAAVVASYVFVVFPATMARAATEAAKGGSAEGLRAKQVQLKEALAHNAFGRPLHLESKEGDGRVQGDLYAILDHPFAKLEESLDRAQSWCEILVLPMHVQSCEAGAGGQGTIKLSVARKLSHEKERGVDLQFAFAIPARAKEFTAIELTAAQGPVGTRDYRIVFEAIPADEAHSFIHLAYSYAYGGAAKLVTQAYLNTSGRDKVGFTQEGGKGETVGGMRGVLERNAMRYFLAVDAYLRSLSAPAGSRIEQRLKTWHASLERYPKQLHEPQPDYVALKREQMKALEKSG